VNDGAAFSVAPVLVVCVMPVISIFQLPDAVPVPLTVSNCENAAYATDASPTRTTAAIISLFLIEEVPCCFIRVYKHKHTILVQKQQSLKTLPQPHPCCNGYLCENTMSFGPEVTYKPAAFLGQVYPQAIGASVKRNQTLAL
jgi:hypothetical protein